MVTSNNDVFKKIEEAENKAKESIEKEKNEVEIQNYTRRHINAVIKHADCNAPIF